jgi:hypothetical protein
MLRRPLRRRSLAVEQLECRDVPASMVVASYFDSALYQIDSDTGALQETLVASGSSSLLNGISGIAVGPDGNLYMTSQGFPGGSPSNSVVKFNYANRTVSTFISSAVLQQVATANGETNFAPAGLRFGPDGNLYVTMNGGYQVAGNDGVVRFKINSSSNGLTYGNQATVVGNGALFQEPTGMTFGSGADANTLFVSSSRAGTVVKIENANSDAPTSSVFIAAGSNSLDYPSGLTFQGDDLYVVDLGANNYAGKVLRYNADGTFDSTFVAAGTGGSPGDLMYQFPSDAIFDSSGNMYTANLGVSRSVPFAGSVNKYDSNGNFSSAIMSSASSYLPIGAVPSQLAFFGSPPVVPPPPPPTAPIDSQVVASGTKDGKAGIYTPNPIGVYNPTPTFVNPFGGLNVEVRTATGDFDHDGVDDIVVVTGPGTPTLVAVVNGADPFTLLVPAFSPFPGSETFSGGAFVASGDFNNDGFADFAVSPDVGGGARVTVWTATPPSGLQLLKNFIAFSDPNFRGGARLAAGDMNNDGRDDLGVAAGFEGGPRVSIYDGAALLNGSVNMTAGQEPSRLANFFVFDGSDIQTLRNGAYIAMGDFNGDGFADLVVGAGGGGAPRIRILSGDLITTAGQGATANPIADFIVNNATSARGGVHVATKNADGDALSDLVIGSGENQASRIRTYLGADFSGTGEPTPAQDFDPFGAVLPGGVFVG